MAKQPASSLSFEATIGGLKTVMEMRVLIAPSLPPAYAQCLKDALKHLRKADAAVRAADMILCGGKVAAE